MGVSRHLLNIHLGLRRFQDWPGIKHNIIILDTKLLCTISNANKQSVKNITNNSEHVSKLLISKIKTSGPVTIADFMKLVLTNPMSGYYMNRDVFGSQGDFVTSPEISQLFGEMIGLWFINEWTRIGSPKPMQIIELGPGRGTMIKDILRVFHKLKLTNDVTCCLVEVSSELSRLQAETLCPETTSPEESNCYRHGTSHHGISVEWYRSLEDVPRKFSCIVAHEFFDALPIHKFQKTEHGWREILIDIDPSNEKTFRYVISRMATPASMLLLKADESQDHIEVCPQAMVIAQHLATRLEEDGGIALIADYGHYGEKTDTFRAFKKHKLHDPLVEPGSADLTADVDFRCLQDAVSDKLACFGPVTQREFLLQLHIEKRLEILLKSLSSEEAKALLESGFHMITDEDKMGQCFKFFALYPLVLKDYLTKRPPPGFLQLSNT